jgi:hypothetical protein
MTAKTGGNTAEACADGFACRVKPKPYCVWGLVNS